MATNGPFETVEAARVPLSYVAPPGCPSESQFKARVEERVTVDWRSNATLATSMFITIDASATGFAAHMEYVDESGTRALRSVQAHDCEQVVVAMALVTAIAIQFRGSPDLETGTLVDASGTNAQGSVTRGSPPSDALTSPSPQAAPTRLAPLRQELGVSCGAVYGVAKGLAIGAGALWGIGRGPFPTLRIAGSWHEYGQAPPSVGPWSQYRLIVIAPHVCVSDPLTGSLPLALCAGLSVGHYRARTRNSDSTPWEANSDEVFWAAAELAVPLRMRSGSAFVELQPVVRYPVVNANYEHRVLGHVEYRMPPISFSLDLAIGLVF